MRPLLLALLLAAGLIHNQATAQEKTDAPVRLLYSAKNLPAGELHAVLEKHYDGVDTVKFVVEKQANLLSIRATNQAALDDVLKTLSTLDKTPRSIAFQGLVIDAAAPAEGAAPVELDRTLLTGPADAVLTIARGWVKEGKAARVRTFNWTGLENQVSEDTIGEIVPRVTGMMVSARGQFPSYSDTNLGTIFSVKPRVNEANDIICELIYNHSELDPKTIAEKKPDGTVEPGRIRQGRAQTTVNVPTGRSVVISAREAGPDGPASLVVFSAAVVNPNAPAPPGTPSPAPAGFAVRPAEAAARPARGNGVTFSFSSSSSSLLSLYRSDEFAKTIKLTAEQNKKLEELAAERDKTTTEMSNKLRERGGLSFSDAATRDEMNAIQNKRREVDERAIALLTAEQKKALEAFVEENRRAARGRAGGFGEAFGDVMVESGRLISPRDRLPMINRSLERLPNDPRYLLMRAQVYAADEKWDEALADYRKVMEADPRNLAALSDLAAVLAFRGDEPGYRQFTEQLLERFGNESTPAEKLRVADACLLRSEWLPNAAVAESLLQTAIEAIPDGVPQARGRIDITEVAGLAGGGFPASANSSPSGPDVLVAKGRLHILRGQPDEAIKLLQPFVDGFTAGGRRSRPDLEVSAWCSLAIAQLSKGNKDAANAALTQARNVQLQGSPSPFGSSLSTSEVASKVRLQRTEQILRDAGAKPVPAK